MSTATATAAPETAAPASSFKMLRAMVGIGVACALLIVLTFEGTKSTIEKNRAEALERAIFKVLPGITQKRTFRRTADDSFELVEDGDGAADKAADGPAQLVYAGYDEQGALVGLAVEASGMGFADVLQVLYGYDPNQETIIGFHVLASKETPGLGDKIEKDEEFLANFDALDVSLTDDRTAIKNRIVPVKNGQKTNPWEVGGITGATISSRAIGDLLGENTEKWMPILHRNKDAFLMRSTDERKEPDG